MAAMTYTETAKMLPGDPMLIKLLEAARLTNEQVIFDQYGFDKTYPQLLADILATRDILRSALPSAAIQPNGMLKPERPYLGIVTNGGYEFCVSFFAIRSIGGAAFPFSPFLLPEEGHHFLTEMKSFGIIWGSDKEETSNKIVQLMQHSEFTSVRVSNDAAPIPTEHISIDESTMLDPQRPGIVLCTSGTTGMPKAAIFPRQTLIQPQPPTLGKATLSYRPPNWRGGFASAILPLLSGHKLYSLKQHATADNHWEILRKHKITLLIFNPVILRRMKEEYDENIAPLDEKTRNEYIQGFKNIGCIRCSGAFLSPHLLKFYSNLTGLPFKNAYGQTECGATVTEVDVSKKLGTTFSVGQTVTDHQVQVKLSDGKRGEFLVKTPWMMLGYINNDEATKAAFDEDGYLKTGDAGHLRDDGDYVFEGRMKDDFIGRVPRIPVEFAINNLPYVAEAHVLNVPDYEVRAVCGALIKLKPGTIDASELTIERLHQDLSPFISTFMRPYLLRIVDEAKGEEIPYTASQKPNKPAILANFFCKNGFWQPDDPAPGVKVWYTRLTVHDQANTETFNPFDFQAL